MTISPGEEASTIQYGYRKRQIHAGMFSQTLAHWTKKQRKKVRRESEYGKKFSGREKKSRRPITVARANVPPGSLLPEAVDELPNEPNLHQ